MIIYNKVEDIFHTSRRILIILQAASECRVPIKWLMIIDFLYCFPQYRVELYRKKGLKFLKPNEFNVYKGSKRSHLFVLEKSHRGAYKLMQAKNLINIEGEFVHRLEASNLFELLDSSQMIAPLIQFIENHGVDHINKHLDIFESKYNAATKD